MMFFTGQPEKYGKVQLLMWLSSKYSQKHLWAILLHYILWHLLKIFQFICSGLLELWFSYAQICETRHRMTLPYRNRSMAFYKFVMQAKFLRRFRQMEMFAVLLHYTQQQKTVWLFRLWGGFSAKVTHFMLVHSKVNCQKYMSICMQMKQMK
jgi:hypothetical protein